MKLNNQNQITLPVIDMNQFKVNHQGHMSVGIEDIGLEVGELPSNLYVISFKDNYLVTFKFEGFTENPYETIANYYTSTPDRQPLWLKIIIKNEPVLTNE